MVASAEEASTALVASPDAVFAPGLTTIETASGEVKLMLAQYVANGGQLLTDVRQFYALLQRSIGEAAHLSESEPFPHRKPDSTTDVF